jgi:DNA repair protein RadC
MTTCNYITDETGLYSFQESIHSNQIVNLALEILDSEIRNDCLTSPEQTKQYLRLRLASFEHEVFACLFLDNRHRVICFEMFRGTIDGASVYPREVVKAALKHNAAAVIFSHNHPSGVAEPSLADKNITNRLQTALALVDIRVLDHIVVSREKSVSMAERGLI